MKTNLFHTNPKTMSLAGVLALLTACGGGGGSAPTVATQGIPSAATLPAGAMAVSASVTTGDRLEQVLVDEVTKPAPGINEYKLSTVICGGLGLTMDQQVTVSYPGGTAVAASAPMGMSGFNQCKLNTGGKFRVQLPESSSFDPAKLQVTITANTQTANAPARLIKVDLYRLAGRASHQELIALNTLYPVAGEKVLIRAALAGVVRAPTFSLIQEDGATLQQGKLDAESGGGNTVQASVTVPNKAFRIAIAANEGGSEASRWVTDTYVPQPKPIEIDFSANAVIDANVRVLSPQVIGTANEDGEMTLRLVVPQGFSTDWSTKQVRYKKDEVISLPIKLTASAAAPAGKHRMLLLIRDTKQGESLVQAKFINTSKVSK